MIMFESQCVEEEPVVAQKDPSLSLSCLSWDRLGIDPVVGQPSEWPYSTLAKGVPVLWHLALR